MSSQAVENDAFDTPRGGVRLAAADGQRLYDRTAVGPAGRASGSIPYNRSFKKPAVARPAWGAGV